MTTFVLKHKIDTILMIISECSNDSNLINYNNIIRKQLQNVCIYDSHLYDSKNSDLVIKLYKFLKFRNRWERELRLDYADTLYYCKYSSRDNSVLIKVNQLFQDIDYITRKLEDIDSIDYEKRQTNNFDFTQELSKYNFKPKSIASIR